MELHGIGSSSAARLLAEIGDIRRFATRIMAMVQLRNRTPGRTYYDARETAGKTSMEALHALKRRLFNVVSRACSPTNSSVN
ncbi:hypothetical protein [Nocardia brasiliensis]|uniref:hypothetical protein n=1 Tax=Nocardia brasiliensis TaxID=37326 RepID=UPI00366EA3D2